MHFYLCKQKEGSRNPEILINATLSKECEVGLEHHRRKQTRIK
jgi:hypothetical protein